MDTREWLDSLKAGDEVAMQTGLGRDYCIVRVARRTRTQIVCVHAGTTSEFRVRAKDGRRPGGSQWSARWIEPLTEEIREEIRAGALRARDLALVRYAKWEALPPATLRAVYELLRVAKKAPAK